jgi:uncharacterized protein (DUF111 family)
VAATLASSFGVLPPMTIARTGYGAGGHDFPEQPNVLRVIIGEPTGAREALAVCVIEANIDDLNPQIYDHLSERLFAAGARDVTLTPTIMKKGRPGIILSVLAEPAQRDSIAAIIFAETTTIGLRFHPLARLKLERRIATVDTRFGAIRVKLSGDASNPMTVAPEYEDCRRAAIEHKVAIRIVIEEAASAARRQLS